MITILIIAIAIFLDIVFNDGDAISSIIKSFHKPAHTLSNETDVKVLNGMISELREELSDLEDELTESIENGEEHIENGIRNKIAMTREILTTYLMKLKSLDNKSA